MNGNFCTYCGAEYRPAATACANCGLPRPEPPPPSAPGTSITPLVGCLISIPVAIVISGVWLFVGIAGLGVAANGHGGTCFFSVAFAIGTAVLCAIALVVGIRLAARGRLGLGIVVMLSTIVGLAPTTYCTAGIGSSACSSPSSAPTVTRTPASVHR